MFSIEKYNHLNMNIIKMIKDTHDWENTEGFIADGLIDPIKYNESKIKIIVILAESYGYDKSGMVDITRQPIDDILGVSHPDRQTSKKISILLYYLNNHFNNIIQKNNDGFIDNDYNLLKTSAENYEKLQDALEMSGWINVKKASKPIIKFGNNATRQNDHEIYTSVSRNKTILYNQIIATEPDLIIACSKPVINGLCDNNIFDKTNKNKVGKLFIENGKGIYFTSHPGYYTDWSYNGIYKMYKKIAIEYNGHFA